MIEFKIGKLHRAYGDNKLFGDTYLDSVANIESSFELIVDGKVVLSEQKWNLVEFTQQLVKWSKNGLNGNFRYYCMDTDEEDIFIFQQVNDDYRFKSSWAEVASEKVLQRREVIQFIDRLKAETIDRVENELHVNLREVSRLDLK